MSIIGHLIAVMGLYGLYINSLIVGAMFFVLGGFLAGKLSVSLRSSGVVLLVCSVAYGYHHEYTGLVLFLILLGFVMACFTTRRTSSRHDGNGWGIDLDLFSGSSGSGSDFGGGDGGGD